MERMIIVIRVRMDKKRSLPHRGSFKMEKRGGGVQKHRMSNDGSQMVRISIMINHPGSTQRQTWPVSRSRREISPSGVYLVPSILYGHVSSCALQDASKPNHAFHP